MPIVKEERYFGPGLPPEGTIDAKAAYTLGLKHARERAVSILMQTLDPNTTWNWREYQIVANWPDLERVIAEADEKFDAECSTELLAAVRLKPYLDQKRAELQEPPTLEIERNTHSADYAPSATDSIGTVVYEEPPAFEPGERVVTTSPCICGEGFDTGCPVHGVMPF